MYVCMYATYVTVCTDQIIHICTGGLVEAGTQLSLPAEGHTRVIDICGTALSLLQ